MVTISDRNFHRRLLAFYKEYGVTVTMVTLGRGTATSEVLDSFGLEAAEKAIQFAFVTGREWKKIRSGLEKRLKIDIPNRNRLCDSRQQHRRKEAAAVSDGRTWI